MHVMIFFWFFFGIIIGYLSIVYLLDVPMEHIVPHKWINSSEPIVNTVEKIKKIKILCVLLTMPKSHSLRAVHIQQTWGKHCDKLLFSSTLTDINLGAIGFNVTDHHKHLWGKTKLMFQHIHKNYLNDYDWFVKGDDDTFLIAENLRYMLSAYSTEDPIYFGYKFNSSQHKRGFYSGGGGYVMSRQTVRIFVEKVLTNKEFNRKSPADLGCHIETDKKAEDWSITLCLDYYNVYAGDSRDLLKRDRFFIYKPEMHLNEKPKLGFGYWTVKYYWSDEGLDCCSNYTISFHYIKPQNEYTMYFLTYKLQPYGIIRRFPPPPKKKNFRDVQNMLDRERYNLTLRGY